MAELPRAKWFVEPTPFEVKAWAEIKLLGNRYRHEIGVFRTAAEAMAACERDAVACSARKAEAEAPVDIRIAPPKQRVAIYRRKAPPSK